MLWVLKTDELENIHNFTLKNFVEIWAISIKSSFSLLSVGIAYDTINKDLSTETKMEGLHNGPPGFEFIIFPSVYKTLTFSIDVRTLL